jgi:hypothetical protein
MLNEPPSHLAEKYRLYAIWIETDYGSRPITDMLIVHIGRPVSFATLCETYIFQHIELTVGKTGEKIKVSGITGIQKIDNKNIPKYELTMDGTLKEIL